LNIDRKVFRIGTVRYHWPMSAHASQAFSIASCTDSEDLPIDRLYLLARPAPKRVTAHIPCDRWQHGNCDWTVNSTVSVWCSFSAAALYTRNCACRWPDPSPRA